MNVDFTLLVGEQDPSSAMRLLRFTAYAAGCTSAALYVLSGPDLVLQTAVGQELTVLTDAARRLATRALQATGAGVLAVEAQDGFAPDNADLQNQPAPGFVAAVPAIDGRGIAVGVLLVAAPTAHGGLSPAQQYVLVTQGMQLGSVISKPGKALEAVQYRAERARAERLRLLESVVVNANDAILITEAEPIDLPGPRIVYCNAAFSRTTGYTEAEILGLTPRILQSPMVDRTALDRLRKALERWEPVEVELLNQRKDGTEFWVELSIVPVADERGWFTHWVSVQRDVSQRRIAEETATRARIAEVENRALEAEIHERKLVEEQLLFAAFHDDLTRLRNRAYLMDRLAALVGASEGYPSVASSGSSTVHCSVLFLDIDRFKLVNDSLGHRAGDLLLMEVARRLRALTRPQDTLARVGGDEFAILLEGFEDTVHAVSVAERIIEALSGSVAIGQGEVFTACSIGIAHATGQTTTPEQLLRDADIAMYAAKKNGGNGHATYNAKMHAVTIEALVLQTDLRHAIARSEFQLDYQPIYQSSTRKLVAVEALVRWNHPQRGRVGPDVFIPIAEEIGMIREIDRWVRLESCRQLRDWQALHPHMDTTLSINVSGDELRDAGFVDELRGILKAQGIQGDHLQLEITESVFLHQPEFIAQVLADIRALGVKVALDDFGTGYSSLGYLDRYQFDTLKIDRSFVARMLGQERTMAIMEGIVRLGSALQLDVVAEGVETEAQLEMLRALGCCNVQGYLLGRPMPAAAITAILHEEQQLSRIVI